MTWSLNANGHGTFPDQEAATAFEQRVSDLASEFVEKVRSEFPDQSTAVSTASFAGNTVVRDLSARVTGAK